MPWGWVHLALLSAVFGPATDPATNPELGDPTDPSGPAEVEPTTLAISWNAPDHCPDEADVRRDVAGMLGEARQLGAAFDGTIAEIEGGHRLQLATHWADGREDARTIDAASCDSLTDAAVLLIAISLDPVATAGTVRDHGWDHRPTPEPEPEPETEPEPEPEPDLAPSQPPPPATTRASTPSSLAFGIRPELIVDWGSLPRLAPGAGLDLSVTWKALRAELAAVYLPPQRATRSDVQKQGAWVELGAVAPRICITPTAKTVSFPVCAGLEMGALRARGIGAVLSTPERQFWAAATGGPTLIWAFIPRLAMAIGLDVVVPITRPDVVTATLDVLHAPESVALRPRFGLEVRL